MQPAIFIYFLFNTMSYLKFPIALQPGMHTIQYNYRTIDNARVAEYNLFLVSKLRCLLSFWLVQGEVSICTKNWSDVQCSRRRVRICYSQSQGSLVYQPGKNPISTSSQDSCQSRLSYVWGGNYRDEGPNNGTIVPLRIQQISCS